MTITALLVRDVAIITAGVRVDAYGDNQPDWSTATEADAIGWLAQVSSTEVVDGRNSTSTMLVLTVPAGTPIAATNRVRIDGVTYEAISAPVAAWTPRGEHHREVMLRVVVG